MALTSFRPRPGTRLTGSAFRGDDPDDPKKRRGRRGFRPKVRPGAPPQFREEQQDATRFNPRDPDQPNMLSRALSNFRMAVDPTQEGFMDRGVPGLVKGLVGDIQRNPVSWVPYVGDAIGYQEGAEMAAEGSTEGSALKEFGGAGIQALSVLGMGELGRPIARALSTAAEHPEALGVVAAGLRRKPMTDAAADPAQEVLELGDPRTRRSVPEGEEGLIETGDMPGRLFSRTARSIELGPDEAPAAEWLQRLTGQETTQHTMPERGVAGTATTRPSRGQPDVPQREVREFGLADALQGGDPQRPVSKNELLQRIDDRMPPLTEQISDSSYDEYVTPGGHNYRAVSIGLDVERAAEGLVPRLARRLADGDEIPVGGGTLVQRGDESIALVRPDAMDVEVAPTEEGLAQLVRELPEGSLLPPGIDAHIGDRGNMLHVRMQDMDVYDDVKTLSVEEIQSDLFQRARRQGVDTGNPMQNTADWTGIAVRRAFREAMDGNYGRLTFPTGDQIRAVPDMGATDGVANYYDKEVDRQVRRIAKELDLPEPRRGQIYEGGGNEEQRMEAMSEAMDEAAGDWDPSGAEDRMRENYQEMVREDIDEYLPQEQIDEQIDREDFMDAEGEFDEVEYEDAVDELRENFIANSGDHIEYNVPAEWEIKEAVLDGEYSFDNWIHNNHEDFAAYGNTSEAEEIFDNIRQIYEDPPMAEGSEFETLIIDLPERPKPFEQLDAAVAEQGGGAQGIYDRRSEPTRSGQAPAGGGQRQGGDRRREGGRRADPQGEGIYEGAERRATNDLDRRAIERAREMAAGQDLDPVTILRRALQEQEAEKGLSKYEQARQTGMRLSALVGATAVGTQAAQRRREGTR